MRIFIVILVGILALFQYDLWFGKNGYLDYKAISAQIIENKAENEKLEQRNQMISAEIQGLTKGFESIEERARMQHDLVKENEIFYHIVKEHK
ncbi:MULTISPECIES: cell division protein FtsB [unclassified Pasteurella]|uniref:cell division protein FtsB n=1 Tax=unclassified Pasteurella TaxID=2621516 RepID=UPI0010733D99|nr:cell division protein FtsB [Pasteurella sp. 19428wF3_WM03]TFU49574.1 cell division protein FtsB [Pasteurella sp. WM03]